MVKSVFIYSLNDPLTGEPKYIGKTVNNLEYRLQIHFANCNLKSRTPKISWLKSLKQRQLKPIVELLDVVTEKDWEFWEQHYISLYLSWGFKLKNFTKGGEGNSGVQRTAEFKEKVSKALKGRSTYIRTSAIRNHISEAQKATYLKGRKSNITPVIAAAARELWKKQVVQLDTNKLPIATYNSIKEASVSIGNKSSGNIVTACKNNTKAYGFYWKYLLREF